MKRSEFCSGARRILNRLEACFPKNSVCLHLRGDQPVHFCKTVGHQSFELRHDSIGGKVTMGWHGPKKSSDHARSEIRSIVIECPEPFVALTTTPILRAIPEFGEAAPRIRDEPVKRRVEPRYIDDCRRIKSLDLAVSGLADPHRLVRRRRERRDGDLDRRLRGHQRMSVGQPRLFPSASLPSCR